MAFLAAVRDPSEAWVCRAVLSCSWCQKLTSWFHPAHYSVYVCLSMCPSVCLNRTNRRKGRTQGLYKILKEQARVKSNFQAPTLPITQWLRVCVCTCLNVTSTNRKSPGLTMGLPYSEWMKLFLFPQPGLGFGLLSFLDV